MTGQLAKHRCEFDSEGDFRCDVCPTVIPAGGPVYWFSDGGYEPRDGTYMCQRCATSATEDAA